MSSSESEKTITLRTSDGTFMEVEVAVAMEMATVKPFPEEKTSTTTAASSTNTPIIGPLNKTSSKELSKIITYIRKYLELKGKSGRFDKFRTNDEEINKEMIPAPYYLDINYLCDMFNNGLATRAHNKCAENACESIERAIMTTQPRRYTASVKPYVVYSWY